MTQFGFIEQRITIDTKLKIIKIFNGFRRKEKTAAIHFDIEKAYDKINRNNKMFEQLENMGMQGQMMEFIRKLIGERWNKVRVCGSTSQNKQTDLRIP